MSILTRGSTTKRARQIGRQIGGQRRKSKNWREKG